MTNARAMAVSALLKVSREAAYSNIALDQVLLASDAAENDKALAAALFYGVLERKITLDFVLSGFVKTSLKKVAPITLEALRIGLYQLMYMERIPQSAAVNESVKLVKNSSEFRNAAFVNAVLRNATRSEIFLPQDSSVKALSIRYSCSEWIIGSFINDYGKDHAVAFLEAGLEAPPLTLRINPLKTNVKSFIAVLAEEGIEAYPGQTEHCILINGGLDIRASSWYRKGFFHVQDAASQLSIAQLNPKQGERVLDMCAAPGGKSFTMAEMMQNKGEIIAHDLYEKRVKLIADGAKRLGLTIVKPAVGDATVHDNALGLFDAILCDVPCSGFGVLRRKPEIKYKPQDSMEEIERIQRVILENAASYLKDGGKLLYSTCTLRHAENEQIIAAFLDNHGGYELKYQHTFMPHIDGTDGFYCALVQKSR